MSACLRRAPWKRSVGSCWTAKGASSGEVRPPFILCCGCCYRCCCCCTGGREHSRARHDKTASRQTNRRNTPLLSAVNTLQQERPRFVTYLNSSAYRRRGSAPHFQHVTQHPVIPNLGFEIGEMIKMPRINVMTYISSVLIQLLIGLVLKRAFDTCPLTLKLRQKLLFWSQTCG